MATNSKISVLMILFLLMFSVGKAQTSGTWVYPMTIHVQDSTFKELGYFKYNPITNTVTTRGTSKWCFQYFVKDILIPTLEIKGAQDMVMEQINEDGSIKDPLKFKEAVLFYNSVKLKWGM